MIVDVLRKETFETLGVEFDPWLFSMLQAATERAGDLLIDDGLRPVDAQRAKQSMMRILAATLSEGDFVLPSIPRAPKGEEPKQGRKPRKKTGSSKR